MKTRRLPTNPPGVSASPASPETPASVEHHPYEESFHRMVIDHVADGVYYVDCDRTITYWNHGAEVISGYPASAVVGMHCYANLLSHVDDAGNALCNNGCPLSATMADGEPREGEVWLRHQAGHRVPVRVRTAPVDDGNGTIVGAVEVFDDASRMREAREIAKTARHDALTDPLTGIPNRRHFDAALAGRLEDLRRYGWQFGLLIADIDHFKVVNDTHGHDAGDAALRTVAATLSGAVRAGDLVSRWGGEEFAVLVNGPEVSDLLATAERLRVLVARSVTHLSGPDVSLRISLGGTIAIAADTPATLLARADAALYRAKDHGRDRVEIAST